MGSTLAHSARGTTENYPPRALRALGRTRAPKLAPLCFNAALIARGMRGRVLGTNSCPPMRNARCVCSESVTICGRGSGRYVPHLLCVRAVCGAGSALHWCGRLRRLLRVREGVCGTHIFAGCVRRTSETATRRVRTASAPGRHPLCSRVPAQAYRSVSRPVPESRRQTSHLTLPNDLAEPTPVLCKGASTVHPKIAIIIIFLHTWVVCSAVSELHGRMRLGRSMCVREDAHRAQVFTEYGRRMRKMVENGLCARETSGVFDDTAGAGVPQR